MRWLLPFGFVLIGVAGLIAINVNFALRPIDISPDASGVSPEANSSEARQPETSSNGPNLEQVAVLERPIFSPTRRPFVPAAIEEPAAPPPEEVVESEANVPTSQPEIELQGTRRIGASFAALVRDVASDDYSWVATGETLQGWAVEQVSKDTLTLTSNGDSVVYSLYPPETNAAP